MGNGGSAPPKLNRQWTSNKLKRASSMAKLGSTGNIANIANDNDYFARYNERELTLLDRMFQDLAKRSPNKTMSKETFLEYFGLPGILGERLFSVFDTKKTNVIDFEEFVTGLARYNRGSMKDKIEMLFELYDLDGQAYVSREELSIILMSLITPTTSLFFNTGDKSVNSQITRNTVEKLVGEAFDSCDTNNDGKLSKEQFEQWVKMNPSVLNSLETVFVKHVWSGIEEEPDNGNDTDNDTKEQFLTSHSSMVSLHRMDSPRLSAKIGTTLDQSQSDLPRQTLPPHFQPLYNQLQEQYIEDSMRDEHEAYYCHICKIKYYKSMYVDDKSDVDYSKYVLFKSRPNDPSSLDLNATIMANSSNSSLPRPRLGKTSSNKPNLAPPTTGGSTTTTTTTITQLASTGSGTNTSPQTPQQLQAIDLKFCPQCGGKLIESSVKMAINLQSAMTLAADVQKEEMSKVGKSGTLHKLGATFHTWVNRYYVIKDKFLYSFKKKDDITPTNVMFISGWFITAQDDEHIKKGYYGIELQPPRFGDQPKNGPNGNNNNNGGGGGNNSSSTNSPPNGAINNNNGGGNNGKPGHTSQSSLGNVLGSTSREEPVIKMLYARSTTERDEWVTALQEAASTLAIQNYYRIGEVLGKGHFSVVHLGIHKKTNQKYAIKIVEKKRIDAREKMALRNEIAIMKLVNHPCIIKMEDVFEDKQRIYMVMTLVEHGDFFGRWQSKKNFKEDTIKIIVWKLLDALHYLHNLGIVHRDLKPENILCTDATDDTQLLISDFGLSKFAAPHTEMTMSCGTLAYVAPEVLKQKGYSWKVDLWSLGCIMHLLFRNVLPFDGRTKEQVIERTLNKKLDLVTKPIWKEVTNEAKDLLARLLKKDPHERIDLQSAIDHKWFDTLRNNTQYMLQHKISADLMALTSDKSVPNSPLTSANNSMNVEQVEIIKPKVKLTINGNNNNNNNNTLNGNSINNSETSDADDKFVMVDDSLKQ